ncbi:hypothetical protein Lesp02_12360 [Lentzea sp. NBRC 105346]|nr:hypothetical protein Lesp02_12360 [Lentzea sp. NBRC 105346]
MIFCLVRTLVSAIRLEEALRIFDGDSGVKLVWVYCNGSRLSHGVREWFISKKISMITLDQAKQGYCDLVITTSERVDLAAFRSKPVIVVPHGLGFHKYVPDAETGEPRLSGLVCPYVLRLGHVTQGLTHPDQERQLAEITEEIVGKTALVGDSSFDLLLDSRGERPAYRAALRVSDHQRLIAIGSTWSKKSLFGKQFELIGRLLGELPCELYRLAIFLHPGVWSWEGEDNIRRWLKPHLESGLMLIGPAEGWHGAVIASDLFIGDNGSTSLYAAMLDKPLLLAGFSDQVVPGTVMAELGRTARHIDPAGDLRRQIEDEIAGHDHTRAAALVERMIARPGQAAPLLRALCYEKAGRPVPDSELSVHAAPVPAPDSGRVHSLRAYGEVVGDREVRVDTYPDAFRDKNRHPGGRLVVELGERHLTQYHNAAVLVDPASVADSATADRLRFLATEKSPNSRIIAVACEGGCEILVRGGERFRVTSDLPVAVSAFACYLLLVAEKELTGRIAVHTSAADAVMTVRRSSALV